MLTDAVVVWAIQNGEIRPGILPGATVQGEKTIAQWYWQSENKWHLTRILDLTFFINLGTRTLLRLLSDSEKSK
jgi:hypothetical protein